MSRNLWLNQPAGVPTPVDIGAYLLQNDWSLHDTNDRWAEYSKVLGSETVVLEVPQQAGAIDYIRSVRFLLDDISRIEGRPPSSLLRDIKASSVDIVRIAIDSSMTRDGRVSVEAGRRIYEAARDMLLAAACSVIDPRPVFAKRKPEEAMNLLHRARFGQTEIGSYVLTIECAIAPRLQQLLIADDEDLDAPFDRRACVKLAKALLSVEAASRESAASGKIEPFRMRTRDGVSANLCDSVAEIIEATEAETVKASFSFTPRRPILANVPRSILFTNDKAPLLREAAARLRDEATYPGTDLKGTVVKLNSLDSSQGGDAVLHTSVDGKIRFIRVSLESASYQRAIEAHRVGLAVRCIGDLVREGRSWVLRNPRDLELAENLDEL